MAINFFRNLLKRKRAMFFSFISILVLAFFMMSFSSYYDSQIIKSELDVVDAQIESANYLVSFFEDIYLPRVFSLSSQLATLDLINYVAEETPNDGGGSFPANNIADLNVVYTNLILNGSFDGVPANKRPGMEKYSLYNWLENISENYNNDFHVNLVFNYSEFEVSVWQNLPFTLTLNLSIPFELHGFNAEWSDVYNMSVDISVKGMKDPLFLSYGEGYSNTIYDMTDYCTLGYLSSRCDFSTRSSFEKLAIEDANYNVDAFGLSFLQRLMGGIYDHDLSVNAGISSLVYPGITIPESAVSGKNHFSNVDYVFLNSTNFSSSNLHLLTGVYPFSNTTNRFKLTGDYILDFNLSALYCSNLDSLINNCKACDDPGMGSYCD